MISLVRVAFDACLWTRRSGRLIGRSAGADFAYYVSVQADCSCGRYFGPIRLGGPLSLYDGAMRPRLEQARCPMAYLARVAPRACASTRFL